MPIYDAKTIQKLRKEKQQLEKDLINFSGVYTRTRSDVNNIKSLHGERLTQNLIETTENRIKEIDEILRKNSNLLLAPNLGLPPTTITTSISTSTPLTSAFTNPKTSEQIIPRTSPSSVAPKTDLLMFTTPPNQKSTSNPATAHNLTFDAPNQKDPLSEELGATQTQNLLSEDQKQENPNLQPTHKNLEMEELQTQYQNLEKKMKAMKEAHEMEMQSLITEQANKNASSHLQQRTTQPQLTHQYELPRFKPNTMPNPNFQSDPLYLSPTVRNLESNIQLPNQKPVSEANENTNTYRPLYTDGIKTSIPMQSYHTQSRPQNIPVVSATSTNSNVFHGQSHESIQNNMTLPIGQHQFQTNEQYQPHYTVNIIHNLKQIRLSTQLVISIKYRKEHMIFQIQ